MCDKCRAGNPVGATECRACGAPLAAASDAEQTATSTPASEETEPNAEPPATDDGSAATQAIALRLESFAQLIDERFASLENRVLALETAEPAAADAQAVIDAQPAVTE